MADYVGSKIRIHADDGTYEGIVHSIDLNNRRMTLNKVVSHNSGQKMSGLIHFFGNDIEKIELLDQPPTSKKVVTQDESGPSILKKKCVPEHLKKLKVIDRSNLFLRDQHRRSAGYSSVSSGEEDFVTKTPEAPQSRVMRPRTSTAVDQKSPQPPQTDVKTGGASPTNGIEQENSAKKQLSNFTVFEQMNDLYQKALVHIQTQDILGLAAEGVDLGRNGKLCWVQICCTNHTFLFDIISLGKEAITKGLKEVLENGRIQKVIHDCRLLSDLLYNQYNTKLINVFDTQVAAVMVYRLFHGGDFPRYVSSLHSCLFEHLDVSEEEVYVHRVREISIKEDEGVWAERPASLSMIDAAIKNVVHLQRLKIVLHNKMLSDFTDGVDIYLSIVRDAEVDHVGPGAKMNSKMQLPEEFHQLRSCADEKRSRFMRLHHPQDFYDEKGFRMNTSRAQDPAIKFCHDGISHAGSGFVTRRPRSPEPALQRRGRARSSSNGRRSRSKSAESRETVLDLGAEVRRKRSESDTERCHGNQETESFENVLKKQRERSRARQSSPESSRGDKSRDSSKDRRFVVIAAGCESMVAIPKISEMEKQQQQRSRGSSSAEEADGSYKATAVELDVIPSRPKPMKAGQRKSDSGAEEDRISAVASSQKLSQSGQNGARTETVTPNSRPGGRGFSSCSGSESDSPSKSGGVVGRGRAQHLHNLMKEMTVGKKTSPNSASDSDSMSSKPHRMNGVRREEDAKPQRGAGRAAVLEYFTNQT